MALDEDVTQKCHREYREGSRVQPRTGWEIHANLPSAESRAFGNPLSSHHCGEVPKGFGVGLFLPRVLGKMRATPASPCEVAGPFRPHSTEHRGHRGCFGVRGGLPDLPCAGSPLHNPGPPLRDPGQDGDATMGCWSRAFTLVTAGFQRCPPGFPPLPGRGCRGHRLRRVPVSLSLPQPVPDRSPWDARSAAGPATPPPCPHPRDGTASSFWGTRQKFRQLPAPARDLMSKE